MNDHPVCDTYLLDENRKQVKCHIKFPIDCLDFFFNFYITALRAKYLRLLPSFRSSPISQVASKIIFISLILITKYYLNIINYIKKNYYINKFRFFTQIKIKKSCKKIRQRKLFEKNQFSLIECNKTWWRNGLGFLLSHYPTRIINLVTSLIQFKM